MNEGKYSPISCEIDLTASGKHSAYLRLPHSVHRSAYGWIPIPIISIKNGRGPKAVLMAGNHGDEYEGQIVLAELARKIQAKQVQGQLLILPLANQPAAMAGLRTSPIDDGNLNRSFPGNPRGSVTEIIAHYIESVLLKDSDYLLDLHSGGSSLQYQPTVMTPFPTNETNKKRVIPLLKALGFPNAVFYPLDDSGQYSSSAAVRRGALPITVEAAGSGTVSFEAMGFLRAGIMRYLQEVNLCDQISIPAIAPPFRLMEIRDAEYYVYAASDGLFEPVVSLGDLIKAGDLAGWIHDPMHPMETPKPVYFNRAGIVVCQRQPANVQHGDCLFHLATQIDSE